MKKLILLKACLICLFFTIAPLISEAQIFLRSEEAAKRYFASSVSLDPLEGIYFCTEIREGGVNFTKQFRIVISRDKINPSFFYRQTINEENGMLSDANFGKSIKKINNNLYAIMKKDTYSQADLFFLFKDNEFVYYDQFQGTTMPKMLLEAKHIKMQL